MQANHVPPRPDSLPPSQPGIALKITLALITIWFVIWGVMSLLIGLLEPGCHNREASQEACSTFFGVAAFALPTLQGLSLFWTYRAFRRARSSRRRWVILSVATLVSPAIFLIPGGLGGWLFL